jgi:NTP-dependent ternary system trypsin peptidase co-occuring protein
MAENTRRIPVILPNGAQIEIEARVNPESDVGITAFAVESLDVLRETIEGLAELVDTAIQKVKPEKVTAEFAIELSYEAGKLTSLLVNGATKGTIKLGFEWTPGKKPLRDDVAE